MNRLISPPSDYKLTFAVAAAAMIGYCLWAFSCGLDMNWDLRNYHYYLGDRFWNGRTVEDIYPAQAQSWFNPLIDGLIVALMQSWPALFVTMLLAVLQSLNVPLLYIIARQALADGYKDLSAKQKFYTSACAAFIGGTGAIALSEAGTSLHDSLLATLILGSLAMLGRAACLIRNHPRAAWRWIATAGFLSGAACGLKPSHLIFMAGFASCFLWIGGSLRQKLAGFFIFSLSVAVGITATGGYWMWELWQQTGNPFFPFLNAVFHSPWYDTLNIADDRFPPKTFLDGLLFVFRTAIGQYPGAETPFRDVRMATVVALLVPALFFKRPRGWVAAILAFFSISLVVWLKAFAIQRYAVTLEMLSGVLIVALGGLIFSPPLRIVAMASAMLMCLLTTNAVEWGHVVPLNGHMEIWTNNTKGNWFYVSVPPELQENGQLFIMLGEGPMAYVIPSFPADSQFVRLQGNFNPGSETFLAPRRDQIIIDHRGPIYSLNGSELDDEQIGLLGNYGLHVDPPCLPVRTIAETLIACPLKR